MCLLIGKAHMRAMVPKNSINGFKKAGFYPFNPNIIEADKLAPSKAVTPAGVAEVPCQQLPQSEATAPVPAPNASLDTFLSSKMAPKITESGIFKVSVRLALTNFLIHYKNGFLNFVRLIVI